MTKIIGFIIGHAINIAMIPFIIVFSVFRGFFRIRSKNNASNGADIRALCTEMGVPSYDYNQIVVNEMNEAKEIAEIIGAPGEPHYNTPWNTRLAVAISMIYQHTSTKKTQNVDIPNLLDSVVQSGGTAVVQVPFDCFVKYAKDNPELSPSLDNGQLNILINSNGEETRVSFDSGKISFDMQENETLVTVHLKSELEKNITQEKITEISKNVSKGISAEIHSKEHARATVWLMISFLKSDSFKKPEFADKFEKICTGGYDIFNNEYYAHLEKNVRLDYYMENRICVDALSLYYEALGNFKVHTNMCNVGYSITKNIIDEWQLLDE